MAESDNVIDFTKAKVEQDQEALMSMMQGACPDIMEAGMEAIVYVNDKKNPWPVGLLNMFYKGVFENSIGIMVAKDKNSEKLVTLLVGISHNEDETEGSIHVLAKVTGEHDRFQYLYPDGDGGYVDVYPNEDKADVGAE